MPWPASACTRVVDRRHLRHADARDDPSRADRVVHDRVVGDEAVRRAVDLDVVDGTAAIPSSRCLELLHDLVVVEVRASKCVDVQPRDDTTRWQRSSVVPSSPPARGASRCTFGKLPSQQEAQDSEQLDELARRVLEAHSPVGGVEAVAVDQAVVEPFEVQRGSRTGSVSGRCFSCRLPNVASSRAHCSEYR